MARTVDRQVVNGVTYEIMDAAAREAIDDEVTDREAAIAEETAARESDVAELKSAVNYNGQKTPNDLMAYAMWEQGGYTGLDTETPTETSAANRIRAEIPFTGDNTIKIKGNSSYNYVFAIHKNGTRIKSRSSWAEGTEVTELEAGADYILYIAIKKSDDSDLEPYEAYGSGLILNIDERFLGFPAELPTRPEVIEIINETTAQQREKIEHVISSGSGNLAYRNEWVQGGYTGITTNPVPTNVTNRIRLKIHVKVYDRITMNMGNKDYDYIVGWYTKGGTVVYADATWYNGERLKKTNGEYDLYVVIRKNTDEDIEPWEIVGTRFQIIVDENYIGEGNEPLIIRNTKAITNMLAVRKTLGATSNYFTRKCCVFHISDTHSDVARWQNFMKFTAELNPDAVIHTGDIVRYTALDDYNHMYDNLPDVPTLVALGNHDVGLSATASPIGDGGLTNEQAYDIFIKPLADKYMFQASENYYFVDINGVRFIVINNYDYDAHSGSTFESRTYILSQDQVDWFISTLKDAANSDIPVVVCAHECDYILLGVDGVGKFNQRYPDTANTTKQWTGHPLCDIIEAFIDGGSIQQTYDQSAATENAPTINVDTSFPQRGEFVCWLVGHRHEDVFGILNGYKQIAITVTAGACTVDYSTPNNVNQTSDLPRLMNTVTEDAFNAVIIDKIEKSISLVRFGSDTTALLEARDVFTYSYDIDNASI